MPEIIEGDHFDQEQYFSTVMPLLLSDSKRI